MDEVYVYLFISFSSSNTQFYKCWIFCFFTFWVFFLDKSFKLISKYTQKCQLNLLYEIEKFTLQYLKLGKLKYGIRKIGCSMRWTRYIFEKALNKWRRVFYNSHKPYAFPNGIFDSDSMSFSDQNSDWSSWLVLPTFQIFQ